MENKKVVIYMKMGMSLPDNADPFFQQRMELMQHCHDNNYIIQAEFSDRGEKISKPNTAFLEMLIYLKENKDKISGVIIRDSLRLSRDHRVRKIYYLWLKSMGVSVIFLRTIIEDFVDSKKCTV